MQSTCKALILSTKILEFYGFYCVGIVNQYVCQAAFDWTLVFS